MKHLRKISLTLLVVLGTLFFTDALAYNNEVRQSGNNYIWRINNVDQGSTSDLATAINNCIGSGNREIHILVGGTLSSQINLQGGLVMYFHNNTYTKNHSGYGFFRDGSGPIKMYDMTLNNNTNMGIRISRASDLLFSNIRIYGGSIGMRLDSHPSRPYEEGRWVSNVSVLNCYFEGCSSHGLETYGVDGFYANTIVARNCGECGVLFNKTKNGSVGTVDAYRCSYGGGYAGLRFANDNSNMTVDMLYADQCGRGYFVLTGSNNITLKNCRITDCTNIGIWLEAVQNCTVLAGCSNCGVAVTDKTGSSAGSYANVSGTCNTGSYYQLKNRATGLYLDGLGNIFNGSSVCQWANTSHPNSKWELIKVGNYYQLKNVGTGMFLDGMGLKTNGSDVGQWAYTSHNNSKWQLIQVGSYYQLKNVATGLFLDGMGRIANGSAVGQWANTTHNNSQWQLVSTLKSAKISDAVEEIAIQEEVVILPNPVVSVANILLPTGIDNAQVTVLDLNSVVVINKMYVENNDVIDLSALQPGIYLIKISAGEWSVVKKIIKK